MTQPLPVGGGAFTVDITRAPEAIRELEDALTELRSIRQDAIQLGHIDPPAMDRVSQDAAEALGRKAVVGSDSLLHALEAGIAQVESLISALQTGFAAYQEADEGARSRLSISS